MILCYFCYEDDGRNSAAKYKYLADDEKEYDVCQKHSDAVKIAGMELTNLGENPDGG